MRRDESNAVCLGCPLQMKVTAISAQVWACGDTQGLSPQAGTLRAASRPLGCCPDLWHEPRSVVPAASQTYAYAFPGAHLVGFQPTALGFIYRLFMFLAFTVCLPCSNTSPSFPRAKLVLGGEHPSRATPPTAARRPRCSFPGSHGNEQRVPSPPGCGKCRGRF